MGGFHLEQWNDELGTILAKSCDRERKKWRIFSIKRKQSKREQDLMVGHFNGLSAHD